VRSSFRFLPRRVVTIFAFSLLTSFRVLANPLLAADGSPVTTLPPVGVPFAIDKSAPASGGRVSVIIHACAFQQFWVLPFGNQPDAVQNMITNGNPNSVSVGDLIDVASPKNPNYWYAVINGVNERIQRAETNPTYSGQDATNATASNPRVAFICLVEPANGNANHTDTTHARVVGFAAMYLIGVRLERTTDGAKQYFLDGKLMDIALPPPPDSALPTTTASLSPAPNGAGWSNSDVTVSLDAADEGGAGVRQIIYSAAGAQPIAETVANGFSTSFRLYVEGQTVVTYYAIDGTGKATDPKSLVVRIDKTGPQIQGTRSPVPNEAGWNNTPVAASFRCNDLLSGVTSCTGASTFSSEGANQSMVGTAIDLAGNEATAAVSGINIDLTPPVVTVGRSPGPTPSGWNSTPVSVTFSAIDSLSGVDGASTIEVPMIDEGPNQSVTRVFRDKAGNLATAALSGVNIDQTAPLISGSRTPAPNANGWNNTNVTVSFTCTDALSGTASCSSPVILTSEGANQTVTGSATDRAGNAASATVNDISIDKTSPTVTYGGNLGVYTVDQLVNIMASASDSLSGIGTFTCVNVTGPAYGFNLGVNTYSSTALDRAGNLGIGSTRFVVQVTYDSLIALTSQIEPKPKVVDNLVLQLRAAKAAAARGATRAKNQAIASYITGVKQQKFKTLTTPQVNLLVRLAGAL
jgi:hypothetical protein